ncbi:type II toxin-antitoxin system VapC family toxin [Roseofilum sp. BLCC_M154]|jgi:tRNA(fMet)-specific endonuclease VapC|uniref:Type II toxin-antitoxin system VapC family toxin n=1 Tax=Roseofilum acuticapitatum BLCC-M154 TaxID=3022444 RepID=A0ABT7B040_9CYAN|nr:type II toxin-antitoxin system VapC family toxin [Roseofilum acuticapitatum]MDJ1171891.1 type II toxin-antitoxin system VapC family toxin [Roseofilum acuticapitatum BLCC-M154]
MTLYILDSDHLSLYQRGHQALGYQLLVIRPEQIAITVISVEELIRGRLAQIRKANQPQERIYSYYWFNKTIDFLQNFRVLDYDAQAEDCFQSLLAQKIRVGTQDLKIAAIALSQRARLITRNRKDFERIPGLALEDWSV